MKNDHIKSLLKVIFGFIPIFMICLVIVTSLKSNMFQLPVQVLNEPWFKTTIVDFYFNIFILSVWVIYREKNIFVSFLWIIAFIGLGSIATAFYVFIQLMGLRKSDGFEKILLRKVE